MGSKALTFLSGLLFTLKGYECSQSGTSSGTLTGSQQQQVLTNQITVPAIIKPILTQFDQNALTPASPQYGYTPEYYGFQPAPIPPPLPPIIIDGGKGSSGGNDFLGLMLLLLALKGKNGGNSGGNIGCGYNGGYSGPGYSYSSRPYDPQIYETPSYPNVYVESTPYSKPTYGANSYGTAEVTVTEGYYIDEPVTANPYQYPTIQPYPGREPNEICLIVRTDYPPVV